METLLCYIPMGLFKTQKLKTSRQWTDCEVKTVDMNFEDANLKVMEGQT